MKKILFSLLFCITTQAYSQDHRVEELILYNNPNDIFLYLDSIITSYEKINLQQEKHYNILKTELETCLNSKEILLGDMQYNIDYLKKKENTQAIHVQRLELELENIKTINKKKINKTIRHNVSIGIIVGVIATIIILK